MRVLLQNRHPITWIGGDQVQLEELQQALTSLGVETNFSPEIEPDLTGYDLVHLFNLSFPWTYLQALNARRQGKRVVVSTIYQETDTALSYSAQQRIVDWASKVICLAAREAQHMRRHLLVDSTKISTVPNGVDQAFRGEGVEPFRLEGDKDYVLCVGRINDKNQVLLAQVCRELGVPLVLVGEMREPRFVAELENVGHPELAHLGPKAQAELIPIYKGAKVLACISPTEVFPSVVMEGGLAGCNIVLTKGSASMRDWPNVEVCDPDEPDSIAVAILRQMSKPRDHRLVEKLAGYTWQHAAEEVAQIYDRALAAPPAQARLNMVGNRDRLAIFNGFSKAQMEKSLHLAFLLPAWKYVEKGDLCSARQCISDYFRILDDQANLLSNILTTSALSHSALLGTGSRTSSQEARFLGGVISVSRAVSGLTRPNCIRLHVALAARTRVGRSLRQLIPSRAR